MSNETDPLSNPLFKQLDEKLCQMPAQFGHLLMAVENLKDSWFLVSQIYREIKRQEKD